jgi:release factor glutamine methyltransferase
MEKDASWLLNEKYNGVVSPEYLQDLERLNAGEPLAYIIGNVPFLNCTIYLDSKPLIPRPETEFWTEIATREIKARLLAGVNSQKREQGLETESLGREWKDHAPVDLNILDLCAGSGCIGVAIGKAITEAHITFAEIDSLHVPTIQKNCLENGIAKDRFTVITSDVFKNISGQFDFILSNPPYIDPAVDRAEPSVKTHEPHQALYGGRGGVELIEKIVATAPAYLNEGGQLWLEHEPEQAEFISSCGNTNSFKTTTFNDQYGILRYSVLTKATASNL